MHKSAGHIYDRSSDGDYKVGEPQLIADIYNKKRSHYSEGAIYPMLQLSDFNQASFPAVRNLIRGKKEDRPWLSLSSQVIYATGQVRRIGFRYLERKQVYQGLFGKGQ